MMMVEKRKDEVVVVLMRLVVEAEKSKDVVEVEVVRKEVVMRKAVVVDEAVENLDVVEVVEKNLVGVVVVVVGNLVVIVVVGRMMLTVGRALQVGTRRIVGVAAGRDLEIDRREITGREVHTRSIRVGDRDLPFVVARVRARRITAEKRAVDPARLIAQPMEENKNRFLLSFLRSSRGRSRRSTRR